MSYMRGEHYLWCDDTRLHVWVADGEDDWAHSGWAQRREGAAGVAIETDVVDEFVAMRFAQILEQGTFLSAVDRALARHHGNGGCIALETHAARIKEVVGHFSEGLVDYD